MPAKWNPPDQEALIAKHLAGESVAGLSRRYGVTRKVIVRVLIDAGINPVDHRGFPPEKEADAIHRYRDGETAEQLAARFGVSRTTIRSLLKRTAIEIRGPGATTADRWATLTPDQRARQGAAAHAASVGRVQPFEEKCKRALTREHHGVAGSEAELRLARLLRRRGISQVTAQKAIGPYNVDLGMDPVAVEVFGGGWHGSGRHLARAPERFRYLLDRGWNLVIVWVSDRSGALRPVVADYLAAFVEQSRSDSAFRGEYRALWSDGREVDTGALDLNQLALVPSRR